MHIVTDSSADFSVSAETLAELDITVLPLTVTLDGVSYQEGRDISASEFYTMLGTTHSFPTTSQPSISEFAEVYRRLAVTDPDILSIHLPPTMSGTFSSALSAAREVPEARITHFNNGTLSAAAGWQVEAAARAVKAGWALDKIQELMKKIGNASESLFTLNELKYLIHGGRISHMKGLVASLLNIKPVIGVDKNHGKLEHLSQTRTMNSSCKKILDMIKRRHAPGTHLRVQVMHADNPEGASLLHDLINDIYDCSWLPDGRISMVLGAHSGPSLVGVAFAPASVFTEILKS